SGHLRREVLRDPAADAQESRARARDVEDGPLVHQDEDERDQGAARGRDERPHVLRRRLVRLRRRAVRRGAAPGVRRQGRRPAVEAARRSPQDLRDARNARRLSGREEVRRRAAGREGFREALSRLDARRRPRHVPGRVGIAARLQYPARARHAVRGDESRVARCVSRRGRELAGGAWRKGVTRQGRRRLYLIGAALLVAALVGGRWLAVEVAERAWDRTFAGGEAVIQARDLARLVQALVLVVAITWITGNLLVVYRAIGSVQMPRRLGDLEIVEAIPQRTLLGVTVLLGIVLGTLFSLGTHEWWRHAVLASSPPHFGIADSTNLGRDVGYYVSVLPWIATLQNRVLILVLGALGVVTLLYAMIGSFRIRRGRIRASDYARAHVGVLMAALALAIAWGAVLDPAEIVAGLHGTVDQAALAVRIPGAAVTALISLAWAWRDRPTLIIAAWAALLFSIIAGYFVIPGVVRTSGGNA